MERDNQREMERGRDIDKVRPQQIRSQSQSESQGHLLGARCRGSWVRGAQIPNGSRCCNRLAGVRLLHTLVCGTVKGTDRRTAQGHGWGQLRLHRIG
jgi:hypothetical protein